jgi:ComF family protein
MKNFFCTKQLLLQSLPQWLLRIAALVREVLFPSNCPICGGLLVSPKEAHYGICNSCAETVPIVSGARCEKCGKPLISEQKICMLCRQDGEHALDGGVVLFPYIDRYQTILKAYKFDKHCGLSYFFAEKIIEALPLLNVTISDDSAWVPVPPRPGKIKVKGFDQIDYLSRKLETLPSNPFPVRRVLRRLASQAQKELNAEQRKKNLKGKILYKDSAKNADAPHNVILFDDVYTTGATMNECAAVLKANGVKKVYAVCLCYD